MGKGPGLMHDDGVILPHVGDPLHRHEDAGWCATGGLSPAYVRATSYVGLYCLRFLSDGSLRFHSLSERVLPAALLEPEPVRC